MFLLGMSGIPLRADWKDEIGFTRLQALAGVSLPTAPPAPPGGLTHVEALEGGANYAPNIASSLFTNNTFILKSGVSATSDHANHVATNFYGSSSLLPGSATVDVYNADDWLGGGFLNYGASSLPLEESRAVQNHSWIYTPNPNSNPPVPPLTEAEVAEINMRLDYAIDRDGFTCAVGENNNSSNPLPQLLVQGYHTISVGRDDGNHSAGFTTHDGTGRVKPDIVAPSASPEAATSWTTPMVAGAAGLLHAKLSTAPFSLAGANLPRVVKALLLASATKNTVPSWDNTDTRPLDEVYGAGELNIHHAWHAMSAGRANYGTMQYGIRGWAAQTVNSNARTYYFNIPAGASSQFCAAITWHRSINTTFWTDTFANLNLRLHHASGSTTGTMIAESVSTVDNVELIYQSALAPGNYALVVSRYSGSGSIPYALAWHSLPVVTVAATQPVAREIDSQAGTITITRTGDTALPMQVPLTIGGTAVSGSHYQALPATITIPAGQSSFALQVTPVSDFIAQGSRTVTVAVSADFALVSVAGQSAVVNIEDKPFDAWRFMAFSPAQLANPAISSETADPDKDQLANLIEYGLGHSPLSPNTPPAAMIDSNSYLFISGSRDPNATDITWGAQTSGNLQTWSEVDVTGTSTFFTATDTILSTSAEKRFIRLKITRP
jgi:hypothetical protein